MNSKVDVIVNSIGLSREDGEWICKLSNKHAIWIANQVKLNSNLTKSDFKEILQWKKTDNIHNIKKLDYHEAYSLAKKTLSSHKEFRFIKKNTSLKNKKIYLNLGYYKWVKIVTRFDCIEEGVAMCHCLKGDDEYSKVRRHKKKVYSLRNSYNEPIVTLDIKRNGVIENIFSSCNTVVKDEYIPYVAKFLSHNTSWKKFQPNFNSSTMFKTVAKIIVYYIQHGDKKMLDKIFKQLMPNHSLLQSIRNLNKQYVYMGSYVRSISFVRKIQKSSPLELKSFGEEFRIISEERPKTINKTSLFVRIFKKIKNARSRTFKKN